MACEANSAQECCIGRLIDNALRAVSKRGATPWSASACGGVVAVIDHGRIVAAAIVKIMFEPL